MPHDEARAKNPVEQEVVKDRDQQHAAHQHVTQRAAEIACRGLVEAREHHARKYGVRLWAFHDHVDRGQRGGILLYRYPEIAVRVPIAHRHLRVDIDKPLRAIGIIETDQHGIEAGRIGLPEQPAGRQ